MSRHLPALAGFTMTCVVFMMASVNAGAYRPSDVGLALFGGVATYGATYVLSDEFLGGDDDEA